ncbi:hypothetical protein JCM19233_697 [Vibrio astriarenae]|nr:hypothetical protein JCM19233_697 [Vibrio sp. C7]
MYNATIWLALLDILLMSSPVLTNKTLGVMTGRAVILQSIQPAAGMMLAIMANMSLTVASQLGHC